MDVAGSVKRHVATWSFGGEAECRKLLLPLHSNPNDFKSADRLTTMHQALLFCSLKSWPSMGTLPVEAYVSFAQSVLEALPSSSSQSATQSPNVAIFGEYFVDIVWSLDVELEELLSDAKTATGEAAAKALKVVQLAEEDKATLAHLVKRFSELGVLDPSLCRERLDTWMLESAGLIPAKSLLDKKEIRTRTALFYKQNKFNLLREQSEGYTKLTAELTSGLPPPHSPATGRPTETKAAILERATPVWEKVTSLIGYFDLDPNRALDIILDVLSVNLSTHFTFFLALLSLSPWCGSYHFYDPMEEETMSFESSDPERYKGKTLDEVLSLAAPHKRRTSTPPVGNDPRVLAQVLGFKFTYYQPPHEPAPRSLYLTAALLIREGIINLEDLYSHLSPNDDSMDQYLKIYKDDVQSRIDGARNNQLAMAAPLESAPSNSKPKATSAEPKKPTEKEPPSQKASLVIALLSIGAIKPAIWILTKYRWLVDLHPEIADLLLRIMRVSVAALFLEEVATTGHIAGFTQPRARWGPTGLSQPPPRRPQLVLQAPTPPNTCTTDFVFFFPDWTDEIPICKTLADLMHVIHPLMKFVGVHLSRDPIFFSKYMRLARKDLLATTPIDPDTKRPGKPDPEDPIRQFWFRVLRMYVLPALPLIRGNAVCTVDVWVVIRQFDIEERWKLYGEWGTMYKSNPELRIRSVQAERESKGILRRLAHDTIDSLAGSVAKLTHGNPCIFFRTAVNQVMVYDNMAEVVILSLKYVTSMGFDVLVYVILEALSNPDKQRVKDDGVNTSAWLQSIASFTGMLFRRFNADVIPVLKYLVHQLHNGKTSEIIVLRELIWKMAGIEPLPTLSEAQIMAMAGGPTLRIESIASSHRGARLDPTDMSAKAPQRLGKALIESDLALPLLIQVAQQRQSSIYFAADNASAPLKSLAGLADATHGVLLQYLDLLTSPTIISKDDYTQRVLPDLGELSETYGIQPPICMQIIRPMLHSNILASALTAAKLEKETAEEAEKRLRAQIAAKRDSANPPTNASRVASPAVPDDNPWLPELFKLFDAVKKLIPEVALKFIGPGFYLTFWQLSTYDLTPPGKKYDEEVAALRILSHQEDSKYNSADKSHDRAKRATASLHRLKRDRYNQFIATLTEELKDQTTSRQFTLKRLSREKHHWFSHMPKSSSLVAAVIEHCIQPRCLLSPMDADFCAQMIKIIHTQGTPGFHSLACYDKLLGDHIKVVLFTCSEYEAKNYGRCLLGMLTDLHKWHEDETSYNNDNRSKMGGKTVLHPGFQIRFVPGKPVAAEDIVTWEQFRQAARKWYRKIAKSLIECIQTGEFMHVYNAIMVLQQILPIFPLASLSGIGGVEINRAMDRFIENEERGDLGILAKSYSAALKKREAHWNPAVAPPKATGVATPRPRGTPVPTGPSARGSETRRNTQAPPSAPSGPRADSTVATSKASTPVPSSLESLRPAVVKRVGRDQQVNDKPSSLPPKPSADADIVMKDLTAATATSVKEDQIPQDKPRSDGQVMPPPSAPSQTMSAQELRETAKMSINRGDKIEEKSGPSAASTTASPRARSLSPSSRPGTRNHSSDSRPDPSVDDKRDSRQDLPPPTRRDSLTHTRRERTSTHENDRDRGRDRHGDWDSRDRDRDRDRHGERDRDRHRRDDKDREKKDRGQGNGPSSDRSPRGSNHRNGDDPSASKRRRGDEDSDRQPSKRSSRKDAHREERPRRAEKDHERERDRRGRRDREGSEIDGRSDKGSDKRGPDGPSSSRGNAPPPSGPRAMASPEAPPPRGGKVENRDRDRHRDQAPQNGSAIASGSTGPADNGLLSRLSEKDPRDGPPQGNQATYRSEPNGGGRRDGGRKRGPPADREVGDQMGESSGPPSKRSKVMINRERFLRKTLPPELQGGGDKGRRRD